MFQNNEYKYSNIKQWLYLKVLGKYFFVYKRCSKCFPFFTHTFKHDVHMTSAFICKSVFYYFDKHSETLFFLFIEKHVHEI